MKLLRKNLFLQKAILLALFPSFAWLPVATYANPNPDGANVLSGEVTFDLDGDTLNILQSSSKSIIEWDDFSIGAGESTIFNMGTSGASLNRVTGSGISALDGLLQADGTVWLINPNGIIQGPNGLIDVGGLLLSTLDVSNDVFLNGGDVLLQGNSQASIITNGTIKAADGGEIYVVAHNIEINGAIGGIDNRVVLARGGEVLIEQGRNGNVMVSGAVGLGHITVGETGSVEGAEAILASTGNAMSLAVQNRGTIRANTSDRSGGRILLKADGGIESTG
ncbi:MAG: filamentous hemagglutinin N-terminal domain-containing protein, partial [Verrucomicrobiota bacterium]